jgi:hypothetical protein
MFAPIRVICGFSGIVPDLFSTGYVTVQLQVGLDLRLLGARVGACLQKGRFIQPDPVIGITLRPVDVSDPVIHFPEVNHVSGFDEKQPTGIKIGEGRSGDHITRDSTPE